MHLDFQMHGIIIKLKIMNENLIFKTFNYFKISSLFHIIIFSLFLLSEKGFDFATILFTFFIALYLLLLFPSTIIWNVRKGFQKPTQWIFVFVYILSHSAYAFAILLHTFSENQVEWTFLAQIFSVGTFIILLPTLIKNFDQTPVKFFMFSSMLFYILHIFL